MAAASDDPKTTSEAGGVRSSRFGGLLRFAGWAALIIIVLAGLWFFHAGQLFLNDANRRNMSTLSVAANGLQYWPDSIRGIARSQFVSTIVREAPPDKMLEGWDLTTTVRNPDFGRFEIFYAVVGTDVRHEDAGRNRYTSCKDLKSAVESKIGTLPFVDNPSAGGGRVVRVFGQIPLSELRIGDFTRLRTDIAPDEDVSEVVKKAHIRPLQSASDVNLCFGAEVPTQTLIRFEETRDTFSNFLLVDGAKRVVQQFGEDTLPVEELGQLRETDESVSRMIATSGGHQAPAKDDRELSQAVGPETLQVAGRYYIAYVQPFHLPVGLEGCNGRPEQAADAASQNPTESPAARSGVAGAAASPSKACYLVGLVRREKLWGDAVRPMPLFIFALALINGLLLCAFPVARLLTLGRNDSLPRYNIALIVGGAIVGVSLIVIALLTWADITFERQRMATTAKHTTEMIAQAAAGELAGIIASGLAAAEGEDRAEQARLQTIRSLDRAERVKLDPDPLDLHFAEMDDRVEGVETVVHLAAGNSGRPVACQFPALSTHRTSTARFEITGRKYYRSFREGRFSGAFKGDSFSDAPGSLHYVVDQVRSQTDGVNKAIILIESSDPVGTVPPFFIKDSKTPKDPKASNAPKPCQTQGYIIGGVIGSLQSPILPSGFEMATVDRTDLNLPVKFHSRPERIGVEQLAREIDPTARQRLIDWLHSGTRDIAAKETYGFTALKNGVKRQFFARLIPNTPWLVTVSYPLAAADQLPVARAERAIVSGLTLGLVLLLLWWLSALTYPRVARNLWPHEKPDKSVGRAIGAMSYGAVVLLLIAVAVGETALALGALRSVLVVYGIAILATVAVAILYVQSHAAPRLIGVLSPANERAFARLSIAFLFCVSIVPTIAIWRDAAVYVDAQERLRATVDFSGPEGSVARHKAALRLIARSWYQPKQTGPAKPDATLHDTHIFVGEDGGPLHIHGPLAIDQVSSAVRGPPESFYGKWFSLALDQPIPARAPECRRGQDASADFCLLKTRDPTHPNLIGYAPSHTWRLGGLESSLSFLFAALLLLLVLGWALWRLLQASLGALFGFGTPLGMEARRLREFTPLYPLRHASPLVEMRLAEHLEQPPLRGPGRRDARRAYCCLVREALPLPAEIIFGRLAHDARDGRALSASDLPLSNDGGANPEAALPDAALNVVLAWALRVDARSKVEAVSYLRDLLERHYRSLWEGLSLPERVDLYHLAYRRITNIGRAVPAFASFLRQGLIVLDPAPRLMNESFAAFVREVEQSSTIRSWATKGPTSPLNNSRLLLLVGAPAVVVSFGLIVVWTGADPSTILPLFATGIPALIALLQKLRQQSAH